MIKSRRFFASIWKFQSKFYRSICQQIFYNWLNWSCVVCLLFMIFFVFFCNFLYIAWTIFKFVTCFWSFFSMHMKIQYCVFAFYFVKMNVKSILFMLKNENDVIDDQFCFFRIDNFSNFFDNKSLFHEFKSFFVIFSRQK